MNLPASVYIYLRTSFYTQATLLMLHVYLDNASYMQAYLLHPINVISLIILSDSLHTRIPYTLHHTYILFPSHMHTLTFVSSHSSKDLICFSLQSLKSFWSFQNILYLGFGSRRDFFLMFKSSLLFRYRTVPCSAYSLPGDRTL